MKIERGLRGRQDAIAIAGAVGLQRPLVRGVHGRPNVGGEACLLLQVDRGATGGIVAGAAGDARERTVARLEQVGGGGGNGKRAVTLRRCSTMVAAVPLCLKAPFC